MSVCLSVSATVTQLFTFLIKHTEAVKRQYIWRAKAKRREVQRDGDEDEEKEGECGGGISTRFLAHSFASGVDII